MNSHAQWSRPRSRKGAWRECHIWLVWDRDEPGELRHRYRKRLKGTIISLEQIEDGGFQNIQHVPTTSTVDKKKIVSRCSSSAEVW